MLIGEALKIINKGGLKDIANPKALLPCDVAICVLHTQLLEERNSFQNSVCLFSCDQQGLKLFSLALLPDENFNLHNRKAHTANSLCEFTFGKLDLWECAEAGGSECEREEKVSLAACICAGPPPSLHSTLSWDIITFDLLYMEISTYMHGIKLMPKAALGRCAFCIFRERHTLAQ